MLQTSYIIIVQKKNELRLYESFSRDFVYKKNVNLPILFAFPIDEKRHPFRTDTKMNRQTNYARSCLTNLGH